MKNKGFTRLVKPFRSDLDSPVSPSAQSSSQSSQTKYRNCVAHSYGFTLAETLITLTILGVVAAILIPNIINHYQEKVTVVKLKKVYVELQRAYDLARVYYGSTDNWHNHCSNSNHSFSSPYPCNTGFFQTVTPYSEFLPINNGRKCPVGLADANGCYINYTDIKYLNNKTITAFEIYGAQAYLKSGEFIVMKNNYPAYNGYYCASGDNGNCGSILVDINGTKKPNQFGRDIFSFALNKKGIYPAGDCTNTNTTSTCTKYVIQNGNMKYLR